MGKHSGEILWRNTKIPTTVVFILHEEAVVDRAPCSVIHLFPEGNLGFTGVQIWLERQIVNNGL